MDEFAFLWPGRNAVADGGGRGVTSCGGDGVLFGGVTVRGLPQELPLVGERLSLRSEGGPSESGDESLRGGVMEAELIWN